MLKRHLFIYLNIIIFTIAANISYFIFFKPKYELIIILCLIYSLSIIGMICSIIFNQKSKTAAIIFNIIITIIIFITPIMAVWSLPILLYPISLINMFSIITIEKISINKSISIIITTLIALISITSNGLVSWFISSSTDQFIVMFMNIISYNVVAIIFNHRHQFPQTDKINIENATYFLFTGVGVFIGAIIISIQEIILQRPLFLIISRIISGFMWILLSIISMIVANLTASNNIEPIFVIMINMATIFSMMPSIISIIISPCIDTLFYATTIARILFQNLLLSIRLRLLFMAITIILMVIFAIWSSIFISYFNISDDCIFCSYITSISCTILLLSSSIGSLIIFDKL